MSLADAMLVAVAALSLSGCRQDMHDQPRYQPLDASNFFADGRSARPVPAGTVSRNAVIQPGPFDTGTDSTGHFTDQLPVELTKALVLRGRERFEIYCSPCHGLNADGNGTAALRGVRAPPSLLTDRARRLPAGYIFAVITNGFGGMPDYSDQVQSRDRWAIITYVRALQIRQQATLADVPPDRRGELDGVQ